MPTGKCLPSPRHVAFFLLLTLVAALSPLRSFAQASASGPQDEQGLVYQMLNFEWYTLFHGWANASGEESSQDPRKRTQYFFSNIDGGNYQRDIVHVDSNGNRTGFVEHVMIDMTGPGMLTRFFLAGPQAQGNLRFYVDGNLVKTTPLDTFMEGNAFPTDTLFRYPAGPPTINVGGATPNGQGTAEVPPGLDMYLPIPFANHIVVTYDGPSNHDSTTFPVLDYIWEYTRFRPDTMVTPWNGSTATPITYNTAFAPHAFTPVQAQPEGQAQSPFTLQQWTDSNAQDPFNMALTDSNHLWFSSGASDDGVTVTIPAGGWAYRWYDAPDNNGSQIKFLQANAGTNAADLEGLYIDLGFYSDHGNDDGAVYQSIGEFFGSGEGGVHPGQTEMQSVSPDGTMQMRWVMPFQHHASLMLYNNGQNTVYVKMLADVSPGKMAWDPNYSMHFHAIRQKNGPMYMWSSDLDYGQNPPRPLTKAHTMRMMYVRGRGLLVGDSESVVNGQPNPKPGTSGPDRDFNWWGEGDELMYVDNSPYPTHRGTGSEDYYGYAYGHTYLFQSPWTSQTSVPPQCYVGSFCYDGGQTVLNRVRLLDAVPFNTALRYDFEAHENDDPYDEMLIDHTSYFYVVPGTFSYAPDGAGGLQDGQTYTIESKQNGWLLTTHGGDPATTDVPSGLGEQKFTLRATGTTNVWNLQTEDQQLNLNNPPQYLSCCRNYGSGSPNYMFLYNLNTDSTQGGGPHGTCDQQWRIKDEIENAPDVPNTIGAFGYNDYQTLVNLCGAAADVVGATTYAGTWVQGYNDNTSQTTTGRDTGQVWRFNYVPPDFYGTSQSPSGQSGPGKEDPIIPNGVYEIRNAAFYNLAVDVPGASTSNYFGLQLYDSNGSNAQLWVVNYIGNGIYSITNASNGLALDNGGGNSEQQVVQYTNQNASTNQQWAFIQQWDYSVFFVQNIANQQYLSINYDANGKQEAGSHLVTRALDTPSSPTLPWQTWVFQPVPYPTVTVYP